MSFFSGTITIKHWLLNPIFPFYIFHFSENCLPASFDHLQFSCSQLTRSRWRLMLLNVWKDLLTASPQQHLNTVMIYYFAEFHLLCHLGSYESHVQCNKSTEHGSGTSDTCALLSVAWGVQLSITKVMSSNSSKLLSNHFKNVLKSDHDCLLILCWALTWSFCLISVAVCHVVHTISIDVLLLYVFSSYPSWALPKGHFLKLTKMSSSPSFFLLSLPLPSVFAEVSGLWPEILFSFPTSSYQFGLLVW